MQSTIDISIKGSHFLLRRMIGESMRRERDWKWFSEDSCWELVNDNEMTNDQWQMTGDEDSVEEDDWKEHEEGERLKMIFWRQYICYSYNGNIYYVIENASCIMCFKLLSIKMHNDVKSCILNISLHFKSCLICVANVTVTCTSFF